MRVNKKNPMLVLFWGATTACSFVAGDALTKWITAQLSDELLLQLLLLRVLVGLVVSLTLATFLGLLKIKAIPSAIYTAAVRRGNRETTEFLVFCDVRAILRALAFTATIAFFAYSFKFNNMTEVYIIVYLAPFIVMLLSALIYRADELSPAERFRWPYLIPISLMFCGIIVMRVQASQSNVVSEISQFYSEASLIAYATMLCFSLYCMLTDTSSKFLTEKNVICSERYNALKLSIVMTSSVFVLAFLFLFALSAAIYASTSASQILSLSWLQLAGIGTAGLTSVLGIFSYCMAINYGSASEATVYGYLEVIIAAVVEAFLFGHYLKLIQMIAAGIVVVSAISFCVMKTRYSRW